MTLAHAVQSIRNMVSINRHRAVPWMLLIALGFIVTMAIISNTTNRIHPDEFDHVAAARFYVDNWLPPAVADPRTLDSYSYMGASYLNEWDIVYLLAGKVAFVIQPLVHSEMYAFRLFNASLFLVLTCMAWSRREDILTFSILLLSPQIWYVFSYFNGDAFPMFLSILAAYEMTSPRSAFNDRTRSLVRRYLRLAVYVGLIILSKRTFWMFGVFAVCYVALTELWPSGNRDWRFSLRQVGILMVLVCTVALPRICYDLYVNGVPSQKTAKIMVTAERLADSIYKPSHRGSTEYTKLVNLRSQGWGLIGMAHWANGRFYWFAHSLMSTFGVYHYLLIFGPAPLYGLSAGCVGLLVATLFLSIILKGSSVDKIILSLSTACVLGILGLSLYHSWVNEFMPQGRYLFAMFPILAVLLARSKLIVNDRYVNGIIVAAFVLSSYSFLFVGLNQIPKYWEYIPSPEHPNLKLEREWKQGR